VTAGTPDPPRPRPADRLSGRELYLDVSDLPAPEPLQLALEALAELPAGRFLHLHHRRHPRLLYERLAARGFLESTRRGPDGACEVFVWRAGDAPAATAALAAAGDLAPWDGAA
jgi:hypothetical protein